MGKGLSVITGISNNIYASVLAFVLAIGFVMTGPCERCFVGYHSADAHHQDILYGTHAEVDIRDSADTDLPDINDSQCGSTCEENATQPEVITISGGHDPCFWIPKRLRPNSITYEPAVVPV